MRGELAAVKAELDKWRALAPPPPEDGATDAPPVETLAVGSFAMQAAVEAMSRAAALQVPQITSTHTHA